MLDWIIILINTLISGIISILNTISSNFFNKKIPKPQIKTKKKKKKVEKEEDNHVEK